MIHVQNRQIIKDLPFEDYLKLPGVSHSDIKNNGKKIFATPKMQLGTAIHHYLLTPGEYKGQNRAYVVPAVMAIKKELGPLLGLFQPELSITCDFVHAGWSLKFRGRGDLVIYERLLVDVKVTEMPLPKFVEFFETDNQLSGYSIAFGTGAAIVVGVNPIKAKKWYVSRNQKDYPVTLYKARLSPNWWSNKVLTHGRPV